MLCNSEIDSAAWLHETTDARRTVHISLLYDSTTNDKTTKTDYGKSEPLGTSQQLLHSYFAEGGSARGTALISRLIRDT